MALACGEAGASPWVSFEPCGFEGTPDAGLYAFGAAPGLRRIWVRRDIPGSILVPETKPGTKPCVYIRSPGGQALVIGSEREVLCKLEPDRPECNEALGTKDRRDRDTQRNDQGRRAPLSEH